MRIAALLLLTALATAEEPDASTQTHPITANLENVDSNTAAQLLKKSAGLRVDFAPQAAEWRANLRLINVPTASAMKEVAEAFHCEARFLGKKRWEVRPKWQFEILDRLEWSAEQTPKITKQPLNDVLDLIRAGAKVDITLDRTVDPQLLVSAPAGKKARTYRRLLDCVAKKAKLDWELRYGVIYVGPKQRLKELPNLVPQLKSKELKQRQLTVALKAEPLERIGASLGIKLVVPTKHQGTPITARATDITLPQALALMLYPVGLTATEATGDLRVQELPPR